MKWLRLSWLVSRDRPRRASRADQDHRQRRRAALHQRRRWRARDPAARRAGRLPLVGTADGRALALLPRHLLQPPLQLPQPESADGDQSLRARRSRGPRCAHEGTAAQAREPRRHVDGRGDGADAGDQASGHGSQPGAGRAAAAVLGEQFPGRRQAYTTTSCNASRTRRGRRLPRATTKPPCAIFVDGFTKLGRFDSLSPEARLGVMQNAGFFRMIVRSDDPYPDFPRAAAVAANTRAR